MKERFTPVTWMISTVASISFGHIHSLDSLLDTPSHRTMFTSAGRHGSSCLLRQSDKSIFGMIGKFLTAVSNWRMS